MKRAIPWLILVAVAGAFAALAVRFWERLGGNGVLTDPVVSEVEITLPGPGATNADPSVPLVFTLGAENAVRMTGRDDPVNERWADIAGNFYSESFIRGFSYEDISAAGPCVWVRIDPSGPVLRGRLEARRLKPNFAYQVKILGDWRDRVAFERIGYRGRWRLPGRATNYADWDYEQYPDKQNVEAYILFDYFVTDGEGNAVHDFSLDHSMHVLWNASRQSVQLLAPSFRRYLVRADNPELYARPKADVTVEYMYGEPEMSRFAGDGSTRLPPGRYRAFLVLTEESFHGYGRDNGYWASPLKMAIDFVITGDKASAAAASGD